MPRYKGLKVLRPVKVGRGLYDGHNPNYYCAFDVTRVVHSQYTKRDEVMMDTFWYVHQARPF